MLVTAQMRQEQGEGHYTPEEHCPTGDQRSGGQELRRGLQATQTPREPWRGAGRPYHCTVEMGLPMPMWCVSQLHLHTTPHPTPAQSTQQVEQPLVPAHMHTLKHLKQQLREQTC